MLKIPSNLEHRSLLTLADLSDEEMLFLVDLAVDLKKEKKTCRPSTQRLSGRNIAAVFEKPSTRTRCAAAVAAADEGASFEYLGRNDIHLGKKESVADTARVLGGMFDGIVFRGFAHRTVELLAQHAGVPVWNGLTDTSHPTQALADLMTVKEHFGHLEKLKMVYLGDGRNNVCNSLMLACAKAGLDFVNCCPRELSPAPQAVKQARAIAERNRTSIEISEDPHKAVAGANVLYTDVWVSMGEESQFQQRLNLLQPYQVNWGLAEETDNIESDNLIFLHCLPAFHNSETELTRELGALEVTEEVFESSFSRVFEQAENRMHTIKAVMLSSLPPLKNECTVIP